MRKSVNEPRSVEQALNSVLYTMLSGLKLSLMYETRGNPVNKDGEYCFIPLGIDEATTRLSAVLKIFYKLGLVPSQLKFLDIGCGYPWIPHMMTYLNHFHGDCKGLEKDPRILENLVKFKIFPTHDIILGDMLTFTDYGKYNVIYYYVPIADHKKMETFTAKLGSQLKPDTLLSYIGPPIKGAVTVGMGVQIFKPTAKAKKLLNITK